MNIALLWQNYAVLDRVGLQDVQQLLTAVENIKENVQTPEEVLNLPYENCLVSSFPNTSIALRVLLTLLIIMIFGERSFYKIKLIKPDLRIAVSPVRYHG